MLGKRLINTVAGEACTTDTVDYPTTNAAYYQLDGNPQDSTTNGYDGVASNVTYSTGKFGQAASFNGTSSKIELPNNAFKFTTFTANYWFNANNVAGTFQTIYSAYDNDGTNGGITCGISGGKLWLFGAGGSTSPSHYTGTATVSNGVWYLATLIVDGTSIKMYLNNVLDINLTFGSNLAYRPTHQFTVGARDVGVNTYGYYNGLVDQFRIFDTALTADQVTDLYDEVYCAILP